VEHLRSGYGDGGEEVVQALEVVRVGGEQGEIFGDGDRGDHQVGDAAAGLAAGADDGGADAAVDAGGVGVEGDGVELVLRALEDVGASSAFGVFVVLKRSPERVAESCCWTVP
jgi:hypothetical protein